MRTLSVIKTPSDIEEGFSFPGNAGNACCPGCSRISGVRKKLFINCPGVAQRDRVAPRRCITCHDLGSCYNLISKCKAVIGLLLILRENVSFHLINGWRT